MRKCILIVIDSLGCGEAPDADEYNSLGANTISNTSKEVGGLNIPSLSSLGIGKVTDIKGLAESDINGAYGKLQPQSINNDSTTGHWELAGIVSDEPFALYPNGFPNEIVSEVEKETKHKFIGNIHASGTQIIEDLGEEHLDSGSLILYTSGDSVFQIAAHENVLPVNELYEVCSTARRLLDKYRIGRVIARPFIGDVGSFDRTYDRKDFGMKPPKGNILELLFQNKYKTLGIGKIKDLFGTEHLTKYLHTEGDEDGMNILIEEVKKEEYDFLFINLVDCDMLYGHREDPVGYAKGLEIIDKYIEKLLRIWSEDDLLLITGDHGNDPTDGNTDHTREYVPILVYNGKNNCDDLGTRQSFTDVGKTICEFFNIDNEINGESLLPDMTT